MRFVSLLLSLLLLGCSTTHETRVVDTTMIVPGSSFYDAQGATIIGTTAVLSHETYSYAKYAKPALASPDAYIRVYIADPQPECYAAWYDGEKWVWSGPYTRKFVLPAADYWTIACDSTESVTILYSEVLF